METEKIELEPIVIDYKSMTKDELITTVEELQKTNSLYDDKINQIHEYYSKQTTGMRNYYVELVVNKDNVIRYYERKFKLLTDIINIEQGGEQYDESNIRPNTEGQTE